MASDLSFVEYVRDQLSENGDVTLKKMFGEYAIYHSGKILALVCDNQLFIKPTVGGRALLGNVNEVSPYQNAKPCFLIDEQLDDATFMHQLIKVTAEELPIPKAKPKKK